MIRQMVKSIPGVVPVVRSIRRALRGPPERFSSADYWEQRYASGGNSGAGSYHRLARFKADFLNAFVREHDIASVLEFGCGDGAQLALADYPAYVGVDVSPTILEATAAKFAQDPTKRFVLSHELAKCERAGLTLSLDVIYHLIEDAVFADYMTTLFDRADRFVIIYSNDVDTPWDGAHVRNRAFTPWVASHRPEFELVRVEKNAFPEDPDDPENTSLADFFVYRRR